MLWDVRALMKPALTVIDMIPDVHRSHALAALKQVVHDGRPLGLRLSEDEKDLAFQEGRVQLTSPMGARILLRLYKGGHIKLKKKAQKSLPSLEAYIATEAEFLEKVAQITAAEEARLDRLAEIIKDPTLARPDELSAALIDKVMNKHLGRGVMGSMVIGGLSCTRSQVLEEAENPDAMRQEPKILCWWLDEAGQRQGDMD